MSLFYLCIEENCNRKYKTKDKLVKHLFKDHEKIVDAETLAEPLAITKENKKNLEKEKDGRVKAERERLMREEILQKEADRIEQHKRVREEFQRQNADKIRQLEAADLQLKEEKLQLERYFIDTCKRVQERRSNNTTDCAICYDRPSNAALSPCGHACFCHQCLLTFVHRFGQSAECPVCRTRIDRIVQLFE